MKLFINYSHSDKHWVYRFVDAIQNETKHAIWSDRQILAGEDWWSAILKAIEVCDCFVSIITPSAVQSAFWRVELEYAIVLNIPIVPIMIVPTKLPDALWGTSYLDISSDPNIDRAMFEVAKSLDSINIPPRNFSLPRPPLPSILKRKSDLAAESFARAEEAVSNGNISLEEHLYQQVIQTDPQGWGIAATRRLADTLKERDRAQDYSEVAQTIKHLPAAKKSAEAFVAKYGTDYDPEKLLSKLLGQPEKSIFLSYSHKDIDFMHRLHKDLILHQFAVWVDEEQLEPGTPEWETKIGRTIRHCACVIVLLSPDAEQSACLCQRRNSLCANAKKENISCLNPRR